MERVIDAPIPLPEPTFVDLDRVAVATYTLGPRDAEQAVVLCHGTPWSAQVWARAATRLASTRRVHLWDMPGYGRSAKGDGVPVDLATQMNRLSALVDLWGIERPHVVAHDIGGAVALGAHLLHDVDFESLHLWDIVTLDPWGSPFFTLVAEHVDVFAAIPPRLHAALAREYIAGAAHRDLPADWLDALAAPWITDDGQLALYRQMAALSAEHTRPIVDRLGDVRCPTAVGWGEDDPWIPVDQAHALERALPGEVPLTVVPGAGHLTPVEAADAVEASLLAHLGRSEA